MITEKDLQEAIAECQGQRNPNANTCLKLASYLTIRRELYGNKDTEVSIPKYSYDSGIADTSMSYDSGTEFSNAIHGLDLQTVIPIIDELMTALQVLQPRLYSSVIRRFMEL